MLANILKMTLSLVAIHFTLFIYFFINFPLATIFEKLSYEIVVCSYFTTICGLGTPHIYASYMVWWVTKNSYSKVLPPNLQGWL